MRKNGENEEESNYIRKRQGLHYETMDSSVRAGFGMHAFRMFPV